MRPRKVLETRKSLAQVLETQAADLRALAANAIEGDGFLDLEILCSPGCSRFVPAICIIEPMDLIDDAEALELAALKVRTILR